MSGAFPIHHDDWALRLSDRIRRELDAGNLSEVRRLLREGDGQARSLEKEYNYMLKGLGITVRVFLEILERECQAETAAPEAGHALERISAGFRRELAALAREAFGAFDAPSETGSPREATAALLAAVERSFDAEQSALATAAAQALDAGDATAAREAVDRKELGQFVPLHDRLVRFMAECMTLAYEHFGAEGLTRFQRAAAEGQRAGFEKWETLAPIDFAKITVFLGRQHMGDMRVVEDEEKFTMVADPCGSGGRLRRGGAYEGEHALPFVEAPGAVTFGTGRLPVYCTHCPIWNSVAPTEWFGHPQWVWENPAQADGSCTMHIYKRPADVPEAYYRQLGIPRPKE